MDFDGDNTSVALQNVQIIQEWLTTETNFPRKTDLQLIRIFLIACRNDVKKCKELITYYHTLKKQCPKLMTMRDIEDPKYQSIYNQGIVTTDVANTDADCPITVVIKFSRAINVDMYDATSLIISGIFTVFLESERARKYGGIAVFDMADMPYNVLFQLTPNYLQQAIKCLVSIWGDLIQQIHVINTGVIIMATVNTARLLLPTKLSRIVHVHNGSWDCLIDVLKPKNLPVEYGGTNGTVEDNNESLLVVLKKGRNNLLENFN